MGAIKTIDIAKYKSVDFYGEPIAPGATYTKTFYDVGSFSEIDFVLVASVGAIPTASIQYLISNDDVIGSVVLTSGTPVTLFKSNIIKFTVTNYEASTANVTGNVYIRSSSASAIAAPVVINYASSEVPAGVIDSVNAEFTLANTPSSGSLAIYLNGMRQQAGGVDYTLSGAVVTFVTAPGSGSVLIADYRY